MRVLEVRPEEPFGGTSKSPVLRRGIRTLIREAVDQTGTGCSMMPVGTSANITEDR